MIYRKLGRTDIDVSVIGLGTEYVWHSSKEDVASVVNKAIYNGINYIDIFMGTPSTRDNIGLALKGQRHKAILAGHIGAVEKDDQYMNTRDKILCEDFINQFLQRLQTDYIDVLFLHNCNQLADLENIIGSDGILQIALRLKKEGRARSIGLSSHNSITALKAVESGCIDVLMYPINPIFDSLPGDTAMKLLLNGGLASPDGQTVEDDYVTKKDLYLACVRHGVGIVAMKPYAGGHLLSTNNLSAIELTPVQCISYALSQPGVACVVPGCKNKDEVEDALKYLNSDSIQRDFSNVYSGRLSVSDRSCMYCNHCLPCQVGIDIAAVTRLVELVKGEFNNNNISKEIKAQYNALNTKASECTGCGICSQRCPFGLDVKNNMNEANRLFSN